MFKSFIKIPLFFLNQKSIHFKAKELTFKLYKLVNERVPLTESHVHPLLVHAL